MHRERVLAKVVLSVLVMMTACRRSEAPEPGPASAPAAKPPIGFLSTPTENQTIKPGTFVSGWALDESGIASVSVVFDDGQTGYVKTGVDFPGVKAQYPNYRDADKAGYIFAIPKMSPGTHSLTVTVKANSGGTQTIQRYFQVS